MMRANRSKDGSDSSVSIPWVGVAVLVTAQVWENVRGANVLKRVEQMHKMCRLTTIWVDGGFDGVPFMQWMCLSLDRAGCAATEQTKGLCCSKRWVVERTFGWLMGCRR